MAATIDWYVPAPPKTKALSLEPTFNIREKHISINAAAYEMIRTKYGKIGVQNGKLILQPTDEEGKGAIPVNVRKRGNVMINVPTHLRLWLASHKLSGKYIVEFNEKQKWVETTKRIGD